MGATETNVAGVANVVVVMIVTRPISSQSAIACGRESKLTQLVRDSLCGGATGCCACMIAHVSSSDHCYNETLQVVQLAAKLFRLRIRRKTKVRPPYHFVRPVL